MCGMYSYRWFDLSRQLFVRCSARVVSLCERRFGASVRVYSSKLSNVFCTR